MAAFPASENDPIDARLRMEAYAEALGDIPAWAASEAREAMIKGQFGSLKWAPSPAEFANAARARMRHAENDLADLRKISEAKVEVFEPSADEQKRVVEGFKALKAELSKEPERPNPYAEFEALCRRVGVSPEIVPERTA